MWENEQRKELIRNIVIAVVLVVLVVGLVAGYLIIQKRIEEEDALLQQVQSSQRQELSDARQKNKDHINEVYQQHLDVVAQYLPGVVCWGDSLTSGSSGNVSYPHTLQKYLDVYLCGVYNLQYSLEIKEGLSATEWDDYKISVPVVNLGAGREDTATILGRSGVVPYIIADDFVIPASVESVAVSIKSERGGAVMPLIAGDGGVNPVTIAGVQGTLTRTASATQSGKDSYQFARLEAGEEVAVEKGTAVMTAATNAYQDYIHIVWLGTYGSSGNPDALVRDTKLLLERQNLNEERYLVIGPCTYNGNWKAASARAMNDIDSAMLQAFGDRYINLRKYLMEDGLRDANLSASTKDKQNITNGTVPNSFRSNADGADLNGVAYELLGKLVYDRMDRLGYLDEIRDELKLDKSTQEILKDDPKYFDNRLNAY